MAYNIPLIIRGKVIEGADLEFGGRGGRAAFTTPDVRKHIQDLPLARPSLMADVHALKFDEIVDYLDQLANALALDHNPYIREAMELSKQTSGLSEGSVEKFFRNIDFWFRPAYVRETARNTLGNEHLDGWAPRPMDRGTMAWVRPFGARAVHVLAGNVPAPACQGVMRNAITRSDAIFKSPSNDPATAAAIARTMCEMAPDHPLTQHLTVAYWKGGDAEVEDALYRPDRVEKIVAWGGEASMRHITKYIQPGVDLVPMDPKLSSAIVAKEAFTSEANMRDAAERLALDVGYYNQQGCANARVAYIQTGLGKDGIALANRFGKMVFEAIQGLPPEASAPAIALPRELAEEIQSLQMMSDEHKVFGGGREGAVIVSQLAEPVDFSRLLADRVTNLVPFESLETPIGSVTSYTQTIGIYPDSLKEKIRDRLCFNGAQKITSLGYMLNSSMPGPHDGIEPIRRMVKWIIDETHDPAKVPLIARTRLPEDA